MFLNHSSKKFLNHGLKNFLNHGSKNFLNQRSKKYKKFFHQETFTHLKNVFGLLSPQNQLIRTIKKIKSKFAAGQLKSAKLPLQYYTESLMFVYPIIHYGQIRFKYLVAFAVKCWKSVSDHFQTLCIVGLTLMILFQTGNFESMLDHFQMSFDISLTFKRLTPTVFTYLNSSNFSLRIFFNIFKIVRKKLMFLINSSVSDGFDQFMDQLCDICLKCHGSLMNCFTSSKKFSFFLDFWKNFS